MSSSNSSQRSRPKAAGSDPSDDARKAMKAAFNALSEWRNETASVVERNSATTLKQMAAAAESMGWNPEFIELTQKQLQQATNIQLQIFDQVMDVWEQQMKNPGAGLSMPAPSAGPQSPFDGFAAAFQGMGGAGQAFPGFDISNMAANPMQFWMQAAEMWQKSWQQAFSAWMEMQQRAAQGKQDGPGTRRRR